MNEVYSFCSEDLCSSHEKHNSLPFVDQLQIEKLDDHLWKPWQYYRLECHQVFELAFLFSECLPIFHLNKVVVGQWKENKHVQKRLFHNSVYICQYTIGFWILFISEENCRIIKARNHGKYMWMIGNGRAITPKHQVAGAFNLFQFIL